MKKKSILMIKSVYTGLGGHDKVIENISKELQNLNYEITLGAFEFRQKPPSGISQITLSRLPFLNTKIINKFDIIHTHEPSMNYYFLFSKKPIVFHYHGINGLLQKINLNLSLILNKKIKKIISVSKTSESYLKKISSNKLITVIYNGIDITFFQPKTNIPSTNFPRLLFVGNLYHSKNVKTLIDNFTYLQKYFPSLILDIIGDGDSFSELSRIISKMNFKNKINLLGKKSHSELPSYYSSCDVFISASTAEANPLPPLEAMACGKPILLSQIPAHKEIIENSNGGLLFDPNNPHDIVKKLESIHRDYGNFSKNGLNFTSNNTWKKTCKKLDSVYDSIFYD